MSPTGSSISVNAPDEEKVKVSSAPVKRAKVQVPLEFSLSVASTRGAVGQKFVERPLHQEFPSPAIGTKETCDPSSSVMVAIPET